MKKNFFNTKKEKNTLSRCSPLSRALVTTDTSYDFMLVVELTDWDVLSLSSKNERYTGTIEGLLIELRNEYGYTLYPAPELNTAFPIALIPNERYKGLHNYKYMKRLLSELYGLSVNISTTDKIRIVPFNSL